jgi:hypothetical protein
MSRTRLRTFWSGAAPAPAMRGSSVCTSASAKSAGRTSAANPTGSMKFRYAMTANASALEDESFRSAAPLLPQCACACSIALRIPGNDSTLIFFDFAIIDGAMKSSADAIITRRNALFTDAIITRLEAK